MRIARFLAVTALTGAALGLAGPTAVADDHDNGNHGNHDNGRDHGRDHDRDHGRDHDRDHGRDHGRDHDRDHGRDHDRDRDHDRRGARAGFGGSIGGVDATEAAAGAALVAVSLGGGVWALRRRTDGGKA